MIPQSVVSSIDNLKSEGFWMKHRVYSYPLSTAPVVDSDAMAT